MEAVQSNSLQFVLNTHQMSEVCHHAAALALGHVQGLDAGAQDVEPPVPTDTTGLVKTILCIAAVWTVQNSELLSSLHSVHGETVDQWLAALSQTRTSFESWSDSEPLSLVFMFWNCLWVFLEVLWVSLNIKILHPVRGLNSNSTQTEVWILHNQEVNHITHPLIWGASLISRVRKTEKWERESAKTRNIIIIRLRGFKTLSTRNNYSALFSHNFHCIKLN